MIHADAKSIVTFGAWLLTMVAVVEPAWSDPPMGRTRAVVESPLRVESPSAAQTTVGPSDVEWVGLEPPSGAPASPEWPTLSAFVADREPTNLRVLLDVEDRWRLMEVGASATWRPLPAKLTAFGQLPYIATDQPDAAADLERSQDPASLEVRAQVGDFEVGVQYRSVGKRLERLVGVPSALKDREGHEAWVAQRFGVLRLRLSDSALSDNVDRNPALPRTTKDQSAGTAELSVPRWPVLGLTYASGESTRVQLTREARDVAPERYKFESVTGSAYYYGGPVWDVTASSTASQSRRTVRPDEEMATMSQDLSLTLRLLDAVTLVPAVSLGQEWSAARSDTSTAGFTLSCAPPASRWRASTFVSYTSTHSSDGSTDAHTVSLSGALTFALGSWLPTRSTLSFEAGYDRYVDAVFPESSAGAASAFLLLKMFGF